jgi:hypothetical protein
MLRHGVDESGNRSVKRRFQMVTKFLITPGLFDLSNLVVSLAVRCYFALVGRSDQ